MAKYVSKRMKKKPKTKVKKTSKKKSKTIIQKDTTEKDGAPEIKNSEIQMKNEPEPPTYSKYNILSLDLIRRIMKVHHIQAADMAIRKFQREVYKMDEIEEAKTKLEEAKMEKQDLSTCLHPSKTLQQLSEILEQQKKDQDEDSMLQITQKLINDAEESLQMIKSNQEEAYFFKFIKKVESDDEINCLPDIKPQKLQEMEYVNKQFYQSVQQYEKEQVENSSNSSGNIIEEYNRDSDESMSDGEKTPVQGSSSSVNFMQEKLNSTLQILSPAKKKEKMRKQSKKNIEMKRQKLVKAIQEKKHMKEIEMKDLEEVPINTKTAVDNEGGFSWFQVWIGHDDSPENIITNIKHWSIENETAMYKKRLQEKHTVKDYWLLWSMERMDTNALHDRVTQIIHQISSKKYQFSFNFGSI